MFELRRVCVLMDQVARSVVNRFSRIFATNSSEKLMKEEEEKLFFLALFE